MGEVTALAIALAALFLGAGVLHAVCPGYFAILVPSWLGRPRTIVVVSGVADLVAGVLLAVPRTRSVGGAFAAVLIAVYLVSHFDAARRPRRQGPLLQRPWMLVLRVVVNLAYLAAALVVARS